MFTKRRDGTACATQIVLIILNVSRQKPHPKTCPCQTMSEREPYHMASVTRLSHRSFSIQLDLYRGKSSNYPCVHLPPYMFGITTKECSRERWINHGSLAYRWDRATAQHTYTYRCARVWARRRRSHLGKFNERDVCAYWMSLQQKSISTHQELGEKSLNSPSMHLTRKQRINKSKDIV